MAPPFICACLSLPRLVRQRTDRGFPLTPANKLHLLPPGLLKQSTLAAGIRYYSDLELATKAFSASPSQSDCSGTISLPAIPKLSIWLSR